MRLNDYLREGFVLLRLETRDVEGVVTELSEKAAAAGVGPADAIREKLLERERLHPTVMGSGLAIPHATVPGLSTPVIGVALSGPEPLQFGGPDQEPVRILFILLSPPGREREHVKLLARICRLARHEGFLEEIERAPDERSVLAVVRDIDAQHA